MNLTCSCSKMSCLKWILECELFYPPRSCTAFELPCSNTGSVNVPAPMHNVHCTSGFAYFEYLPKERNQESHLRTDCAGKWRFNSLGDKITRFRGVYVVDRLTP